MSVKLTTEQLDQIKRHGERTFPEECGGLLLGVIEDGARVIHEILPLENVRKDSRHNRVELDPRDYLRTVLRAVARNLAVWACCHSRPGHTAIRSGVGLELAPSIVAS